MFLNFIITKISTQYHESSTMVNGIGRIHKLGKYNMHKSVFTNRPLKTNSPNYNSHDNYNENIDVNSKESISTENKLYTNQ